jgi:2-amino-4-hydroxy-6-hydroxymethyldihydropteridine diphosphokinase
MPPSIAPELVYLGLGGNLGRRARNLSRALLRLSLTPGIHLSALSRVYETAAWGVEDQPHFLNMAAAARVELAPEALLSSLKAIERELGRVPGERWGPRPVDIDILLFGDRSVRTPELTLPHPYLAERQFVLVPLYDVAPGLTLPDGRSVATLAKPSDQSLRLVGSLSEALRVEADEAK